MEKEIRKGNNAATSALVFVTLTSMASAQTNIPGGRPSPTDAGLVMFPSSIVPVPAPTGLNHNAEPLSPQSRNRILNLQITLLSPNEGELQRRVDSGERLTADDLKKYQGDPNAANNVASWLRSQGFKNVSIAPDKTAIFSQATADQVQKTLKVKMESVVVDNNRVVSAVTPPQLPAEFAASVSGIQGLQPWVQAQRRAVSRMEYEQRMQSEVPPLNSSPQGLLPNAAAKGSQTIIPGKAALAASALKVSDVLHRYNAHTISTSGRGQNIAVLIDTFPNRSDLRKFWNLNNIKINDQQVRFVDVKAPGARLPIPTGEESLDVEWTSGIAPGAIITVYASGSLNYVDLDRALRRILDDASKPGGPQHVSISLGLREDAVPEAEIRTQHSIYLRLRGLGVNVFVSSGDAGSNPDLTGHGRSPDTHVEYPASDPDVISVGGTSLGTDGKGPETCWKDSGGGVSNRSMDLLRRPAWQPEYATISSPYRLVPDVSGVADPSPGGSVILNGKETPFGGTSWSTPIWAGFSALLAENIAIKGRSMGFIGQQLYQSEIRRTFRDIDGTTNGAYKCGPGWNPVTGLGAPDISRISSLLK